MYPARFLTKNHPRSIQVQENLPAQPMMMMMVIRIINLNFNPCMGLRKFNFWKITIGASDVVKKCTQKTPNVSICLLPVTDVEKLDTSVQCAQRKTPFRIEPGVQYVQNQMSRNPGAQMSSMLHMSRWPDPDVQLQMSKCPVCPAPVLHPAAVYTICWTPRGEVWESSILLPWIHPQIPASQHFGLQDRLRVPLYCV